MFDPRPLFFNFYMGPNLFHDMWAPRCVVCSILFVGPNLFHSKWTIGVLFCSLFIIIKENNIVFSIIPWCDVEGEKGCARER